MIEYFGSDESRVQSAYTRTVMKDWLGWLAEDLNWSQSSVSPRSVHKSGERLLLMRQKAGAQMANRDLATRGVDSSEYFFTAIY